MQDNDQQNVDELMKSLSVDETPVRSIETSSPTCMRLPPEILSHIFESVQFPSRQLDPPFGCGPGSLWKRTSWMKSVVLVLALSRTLGMTQYHVGTLIWTIRMDSCVVWRHFAEVVREDVGFILDHCPNLRAFTFQPHPTFVYSQASLSDDDDAFDPAWFFHTQLVSPGSALRNRLSHGLQSLDISAAVKLRIEQLKSFQQMLSAATTLTSLSLGAFSWPADLPNLYLPTLMDLQYCPDSARSLAYLADAWHLPNLKLLTLNLLGYSAEISGRLLERHGATLSYLHFYNAFGFPNSMWERVWEQIKLFCPILEHLVVPVVGATLMPSPTLRILDVWANYCDCDEQRQVFKLRNALLAEKEGSAQRLRSVRLIDCAFNRVTHISARLPLIYHPDIVREGEVRYHGMLGDRLVQFSWGIIARYSLLRESTCLDVATNSFDFGEPDDPLSNDELNPDGEDVIEVQTAALVQANDENLPTMPEA
ncbi:hypothetical protein A0H81_14108 [Grifola frondosa]|uniref:F-box domain-containing protein n=1 Tax=Grifola frondosa TaxID=5627 RepID=A0A1C7LM69_GRIFR|nr:hypothetical protein A0H81_14108 [Grifola frondosa]